MKTLIQRLALTLAFVLGTFGMAQATTLNYTGTISATTPYLTTLNVVTPTKFTLNLTVDAGTPFYLLLNTATAVSYSGAAAGGSQTITALLDLDVGNHLFYAFTTALTSTNFSVEIAPVPLPATLPLLAAALGLGGFALRRRQKKKELRSFFPAAA